MYFSISCQLLLTWFQKQDICEASLGSAEHAFREMFLLCTPHGIAQELIESDIGECDPCHSAWCQWEGHNWLQRKYVVFIGAAWFLSSIFPTSEEGEFQFGHQSHQAVSSPFQRALPRGWREIVSCRLEFCVSCVTVFSCPEVLLPLGVESTKAGAFEKAVLPPCAIWLILQSHSGVNGFSHFEKSSYASTPGRKSQLKHLIKRRVFDAQHEDKFIGALMTFSWCRRRFLWTEGRKKNRNKKRRQIWRCVRFEWLLRIDSALQKSKAGRIGGVYPGTMQQKSKSIAVSYVKVLCQKLGRSSSCNPSRWWFHSYPRGVCLCFQCCDKCGSQAQLKSQGIDAQLKYMVLPANRWY